MQAIHKKLVNDLWNLRWQALAICLVLASGTATFVMSLTTLDSLEAARRAYYEDSNFADLFSSLTRAPRALEADLRAVDGVSQVETRVVVPALLNVARLAEPATGVLISIPDADGPRINRLHLRQGRLPDGATRGEAAVSEAFALAHDLHPGDSVQAIIRGRFQTLRIVGVALSPEYIYSVRAGELLPDDQRFGVFWLSYRDLAAANDLDGAFNDAAVTLAPHAEPQDVIAQLDKLLIPFGSRGAFGRPDQPSYRFLDNELIQLRGMAILPPAIFLIVTSFLLHVVLSRLAATQREQAATLRAFGYSRGELLRHYLSFALVLIVVGVALGIAAGMALGSDLTQLYAKFFRFPVFSYRVAPQYLILGAAASMAAGIAATWRCVQRATTQSPAAAMQPEPPPRYRPSLVERLGLHQWISPATRMVLRHLELQPYRAAFTSLGVSLAIAILVLGNFTEDTVDFVMRLQFKLANRQDMTITFIEASSGRAIHDLRHLPGVLDVEPFRAAPVRLRFEHRWRRLAILGLAADARLHRVLDIDQQPVELPRDGLVISEKLSQVLGCRVGDEVQVEVLEGARIMRRVPIVRIVRDCIDLNAYMRLDALRKLLREQETSSGAFLAVDMRSADLLYANLKAQPRVASVAILQAMMASYERTLAENVLRMRAINLFFAAVVAFGVVYNAASVTLAERRRELATLRVLGFSRGETAYILLLEIGLLVVFAIPAGLWIGYGFAALLTWSLSTEVHRFPLIVSNHTFIMAILVTLAAAGISALAVRRRLDKQELVSVLKARD
ncbi:MAG: FtsX-like permease family protein [Pirellulales bacterium]